MTPAVRERMRKVEALTRSSNAGEAAAARAMLARLKTKYGPMPTGASRDDSDPLFASYGYGPSYSDLVDDDYPPTPKPRTYAGTTNGLREAPDWQAKLERLDARVAHRRFIEAGIGCVEIAGGWLHAATGLRIITDRELIDRAQFAGLMRA